MSESGKTSGWRLPLALLAVSLVTRVLFAYRGGMSDPDSVAIAAGMARYFSRDTSFGDIILYGRQMNPGVYLAFRSVYVQLFDSPSRVILFLNFTGIASATILPLPVYLIMRRSLGDIAAASSVFIIIFTPLVWESSLSFHPVLPATLLLSLAWLTWRRIDVSARGLAWTVVTCILATAAVVTRFELMMLAPAFLIAAALSGRRRLELPLIILLVAIALGVHWLILRWLPGTHTTAGRGVSDYASYISESWLSSLRPAGMVKTGIWFFFGAGAATLILAIRGLLLFRRRSFRVRKHVVAAAMILPVLIFWLPQPGAAILRHYFLVVPAIVWIVGDLVFRGMDSRRLGMVSALAIAINLTLPEATYFTWNWLHPEDRKTPHGTVFLYRAMIAGNIDRYTAMQSMILEEAREAAEGELRSGTDRGSLPSGPFIPVNWESYAYALYGMAQDRSLTKLEAESRSGGVYFHRFELSGAEVRMVFSNYFTWDILPDTAIPFVRRASKDGFVLVIPSELDEAIRKIVPSGTDMVEY